MKNLLIIFLFAFGFQLSAFSQAPTGLPQKFTSKWYQFTKYASFDSALFHGIRDTNWIPMRAGAEVLWQHANVDTLLWFYDGQKWNAVGTGSGGGGAGTCQTIQSFNGADLDSSNIYSVADLAASFQVFYNGGNRFLIYGVEWEYIIASGVVTGLQILFGNFSSEDDFFILSNCSGGSSSTVIAGANAYANDYFDDAKVGSFDATVSRVGDVIVGLIDNYTNERAVFEKTTVWADGTTMTNGKIDSVLYRKKGSEFFKRVVSGDYNIKWWRVAGDSSTNNLTYFQRCFTAIKNIPGKKVLYIPAGTYLSGRTLSGVSRAALDLTDVENLIIRGDGAGTVLQLLAGTYAQDVFFLYCGATTHDITVRDLVFEGDRGNMTAGEQTHATQVSISSHDINFEGVTFRHWFGDGSRLLGTGASLYNERIRFDKCRFLDNHRSGITVQRANRNVTITNCFFDSTNDQDIDFEPTGDGGPENIIITNNIFDHSFQPGNIAITLSGIGTGNRSSHNIFSGNILKNGTIQAVNMEDMSVDNNKIYITDGVVEPGINFLELIYNVQITNNKITVKGTKGIKIFAQNGLYPELVKISGNTIKSGGEGVLVESFRSDISITNNEILRYDTAIAIGSLPGIHVKNTVADSTERNLKIENNSIRGTLDGIWISGSSGGLSNIIVQGNSIDNVGGSGIILTGSSANFTGNFFIGNNIITSTSKVLENSAGPNWYYTSGGQGEHNSMVVSRTTPEAKVAAGYASQCYNYVSGLLYVKTTASGNTGWVLRTLP